MSRLKRYLAAHPETTLKVVSGTLPVDLKTARELLDGWLKLQGPAQVRRGGVSVSKAVDQAILNCVPLSAELASEYLKSGKILRDKAGLVWQWAGIFRVKDPDGKVCGGPRDFRGFRAPSEEDEPFFELANGGVECP